MASVPREERAFVASAADALGYDEQRQPTSKQQLAIAAALAILDGRWRHHAESRQVGLAVAAYGVDKKQVNEFLDKLRALHSGSTAWKPYHDCIKPPLRSVCMLKDNHAVRSSPALASFCTLTRIRNAARRGAGYDAKQ